MSATRQDNGGAALIKSETALAERLSHLEQMQRAEHPETMAACFDFGEFLHKTSNLGHAGLIYDRILHACGKSHPNLNPRLAPNTLNNLGNLLKSQGKIAEAERAYQRELDQHAKISTVDTEDSLRVVYTLGIYNRDVGNFAAAEFFYK
ncbi:hypothetical protein K470DRAFT_271319 [Piedraia hortae CBS 480.64]|uniref:TPR-like protein n=1 Tax=Piedraia hortae CBS 480.64 TaxID=1314780 RepID=A0A6A7BYY5_9PEZI|nr:hypothetical protein K470DRAFT_271319 [Piedraia hortae CBS 480.64]